MKYIITVLFALAIAGAANAENLAPGQMCLGMQNNFVGAGDMPTDADPVDIDNDKDLDVVISCAAISKKQ